MVRSGAAAGWGIGTRSLTAAVLRYADAIRRDPAVHAHWTATTPQSTPAAAPWDVASVADRRARMPWGMYGDALRQRLRAPWGRATVSDRDADMPWGEYLGRPRRPILAEHAPATVADQPLRAPWGRYAGRPRRPILAAHARATVADPLWVSPWGLYGQRLRPGWGIPAPDGNPPRDPDTGAILIPPLDFYVMVNEISLYRADDSTQIPIYAFEASLDADSWAWSCSARVDPAMLDALAPEPDGTPVEVVAAINGELIQWVIERIERERRWPAATLQISGRGRAAELADPRAPNIVRSNDESRTAQQLLEDALTINGAPLGWGLDWSVNDWTVPAGAWSYSGDYIGAALRIAEAAGGYVQAHDTDRILRVLPRYPAAPWVWDELAPDVALPEAPVTIEGIEWIERPRYNAVWVAGQAQGRQDRILRAGTTGDRPAPSIVDALATDPAMTRQRGLAALANTGRQARINLRLPILDESGILRPGLLIDYTAQGVTQRGLTRGVRVSTDRPAAWQSIDLEVHLGEIEP